MIVESTSSLIFNGTLNISMGLSNFFAASAASVMSSVSFSVIVDDHDCQRTLKTGSLDSRHSYCRSPNGTVKNNRGRTVKKRGRKSGPTFFTVRLRLRQNK